MDVHPKLFLADNGKCFTGKKKWTISTPPNAVMSKLPAAETQMNTGLTCTQNKGDILYVPSGYTHSVLNLEHSAAIAFEFYSPFI